MRGSAPHPEAQGILNIPRRLFSGSISGKISQGPQPPKAVPEAPLTDFSRLCFQAASDGDIYSFEPSPFPREGAEGLGLSGAASLKYVETEEQNLETTFGIHYRRMVR